MSLPADYLQYPWRRRGMDHERYDWSMLPRRKPVTWPSGARIALWVTTALEWFPLDMKGKPFKPLGGMVTAYPDLRHYTLRDYGNRVGIFRILDALARFGIRGSMAMNAAVAVRHPSLVEACVRHGHEVIAHGLDMDHLHYRGLAREAEQRQVETALAILRKASGQPVRGWLSPGKSESDATPDLVRAAGCDYLCDWVNDDMPYPMRTTHGALTAMPHPVDIDDATILVQNRHPEASFRDQVITQFDVLHAESAADNGRIMALSLHPWVTGQPYRIGVLEEALAHITGRGGVWAATGAEILDAWLAQQGE